MFLPALAFSQKTNGKFSLNGKVTGYSDSTRIYYADARNNQFAVDSTLIINNEFKFSGSVKDKAQQIMIWTKGRADYKFFWIDNAVMTFTATKGKFKQAVIAGSATELENNAFEAACEAGKGAKGPAAKIAYVREHPNSMISANILNIYAAGWGRDTTKLLYDNFSKAIKESVYGKEIATFISLNRNVKVGDKYVDFSEPDTTGKKVSLSDFEGKLVLLDFWGSWCGSCRKDNPELIKIYNEFKSSGFEILGVASDNNKKDWLNAVAQDKLPWPNVCDLNGNKNKAALIYGVSRYPRNYLIDKNGIIIAADLRGEALRKKLEELLK